MVFIDLNVKAHVGLRVHFLSSWASTQQLRQISEDCVGVSLNMDPRIGSRTYLLGQHRHNYYIDLVHICMKVGEERSVLRY